MKPLLSFLPIMILCTACSQKILPPPGNNPINTINPPTGTPMAQAWSNDRELNMALDTGAIQETLLFSSSAPKLGTRIRGKGPMRYAYLDISLQKNTPPINKKQDVVMVSDAPYDGIIGWKTIRQYIWNLNYPKEHHNFYTNLPKNVKKWHNLSLSQNSDFAQIKLQNQKRAIIDTGAPHALYIAKKDWEKFKQDYPDAPISIYSGFSPASGGYYALECIRIKSYTIGNLELRNIVACESFANKEDMNLAYDIDIILGVGAFYGREFWLDGPNSTLYFSYRKPSLAPYPSFNNVGATFIPGKNGELPYKAKVVEWSIAWQCGLRNDDILISLNGRKHPDMTLIDYVTTQPEARAEILVQRGKNTIEIIWEVPATPEAGEYHPTPQALSEEEFEQYQKKEAEHKPRSETDS